MDDGRFTELIKRYLANTATVEESVFLERWLIKRGEENVFSAFTAAEKRIIKEDILRKILDEINSEKRVVHRLNTGSWIVRAAAAVLLLVVSSYMVWQWIYVGYAENTMLQAAANGQIMKVMLADGSIVWLKDRSTLSYPNKFTGNERHVQLTGEALFEVAKDPGHPFIIQCGALEAKVLGTSFNIKTSDKDIEVVVLTGKVALSSADHQQSVVVMPNEKALYNKALKQIAKVVAKEHEAEVTMVGTEYNMHFEEVQLRRILRRIADKFNVQVNVEDPSINECLITVDLTDQSLDNTLDIIKRILAIQYEKNGNDIILKGGACNN